MRVHDVTRAYVGKLGAERDDSGDHIYFYLTHEDCQYTVGKLSHSWTGSLNPTQIALIAKKLHLRLGEFQDFVDCKLDRDMAIELWRSRRPAY